MLVHMLAALSALSRLKRKKKRAHELGREK